MWEELDVMSDFFSQLMRTFANKDESKADNKQ
jgi:hypothetical protein